MIAATEKDLVVKFKEAKDRLEKIKAEKVEAQKEFDRIEDELCRVLMENDATSTARYEGVGFVSLEKPRLFASYSKDNEETVFRSIREAGDGSIIKETVAAVSLSSFVTRMIEEGKEIPEGITYYLKQKAKLYPVK